MSVTIRQRPVPVVDPSALRSVLGRFCTGVAVITAQGEGGPLGFACQSVTSLSLAPPLVSFCPAKTSTSWPFMRRPGAVGINVLAADQQELCGRFAVSGGDKFDGAEWWAGGNGAPALGGVIARIEASIEVEHDAGDHTIVIARVTGLDAPSGAGPLLFYRGGYGGFAAETKESR